MRRIASPLGQRPPRYAAMIDRFRERIAATETADPVSQDLLIGITARLGEPHWMFQAES
jgi:starvation-inducible DNA-binding protein